MDLSKPLDGELAAADEVAQAVQALTDADYVRLTKAARTKLGGTVYASAEDLVNEAVVTPFRAALGEGGRRWRKDVSFVAFLIMTIKGIASDSRHSATQRRTVSAQTLTKEGQGERDVFDALDLTAQSVEEQLLDDEQEQEWEARNQKDFAAVDEFFRNDDEIQWIMIGIQERKSPIDINKSPACRRPSTSRRSGAGAVGWRSSFRDGGSHESAKGQRQAGIAPRRGTRRSPADV